MTLADQMLLNILKLESVPRDGLIMMASRIQTSEAAVKSLLEKGLIEELSIQRTQVVKVAHKKPTRVIRYNNGRRLKKPPEKIDKREFTITTKYYNLTNKGHIYLADKYPAEYTAWYEAPADSPKRRRVIDRRLGESLCASMASAAGAELLSKGQAVTKEYFAANRVKFISVSKVRSICSGEESASNDYDRLRFAGIIMKEPRTVVLYTNLTPGMRWSISEAKTDAKVAKLFYNLLKNNFGTKLFIPYNFVPTAAILVKNAHHFNQIFNDTLCLRNGTVTEPGIIIEGIKNEKKKKNILGYPFNMLFFPTTNDGARLLKMYLENEKTVSDCFYKYVESLYEVDFNGNFGFRYRYDQTEYYSEPFIEMSPIAYCGRIMHSNPNMEVGAICFDFMEDYLRAIFGPNAWISTVSFKDFEEKYYFEIFGREKEKKGSQGKKQKKTDEDVSIQEENEDDFFDELESFPATELRHEKQQSQEWEEYFDVDELF